MWTQKQIKQHLRAAKKLDKIKDSVFNLIRKADKISEFEVQEFILDLYKKEGLKTDAYAQLVAFNKNTSTPYQNYKASKKQLSANNMLILLDIWAKINSKKAPFSDLCWIGYKGKVIPSSVKIEFSSVIKVRNKTLKFIKEQLKANKNPTGEEIVNKVKELFTKENFYGKTYVGHSLGIIGPHGKFAGLVCSNQKPLKRNAAYALEHGMYEKGYHKVRNEINFYISKQNKLIVTTKMQNKIIKIL